MSDGGMWEKEPETPWYESEDSEDGIPRNRLIAVVVVVAILLLVAGMPFYNPIGFVIAVAFISLVLILDGLCNRSLVRSLKRSH